MSCKKEFGWMIQIISRRHTTRCPGLAWEQLCGGGSMHKMLKTLRQAKPTHPPHWHIAVSSKARWDATASCGTLWAHSSQIWEICASPKSSTPLDRPQSLFKKISQPSGIGYTPSHPVYRQPCFRYEQKPNKATTYKPCQKNYTSINFGTGSIPQKVALNFPEKRVKWRAADPYRLRKGPTISTLFADVRRHWRRERRKTEKCCVNGKHLLCETIS